MKSSSCLCLIVSFVILAGTAGCSHEPFKGVPVDLQGSWVTEADGYEGRYLDIDPESVVFGVRGVVTNRYTVLDVEPLQASGGEGYSLICEEPDEGEFFVKVVLEKASQKTLRLVNRPKVIWTMETEARR
jgi:hypothetical protein